MDLIVSPFALIFGRRPSLAASLDGRGKRILLVRLDHMGDLLMATPAIHALKEKYPDSRIDLLGGEMALRIMEGNDDIARTYTFNATWYDPRRGGEVWPVDIVRTIFTLRKNRYDFAIDMRGDFRVAALFLWCTSARRRIGFRRLGLESLLTDALDYDPEKNYVDLNFDAVSFFHIDRSSKTMRFFVSDQEDRFIDTLLREHLVKKDDLLVGISPTTNRIEQRWSEKRFAEAADRLIEKFNAKIVLVSAPADAAIVELVQKGMRHPAINLAGKTDLGQLGALMRRLRLFIANDSGPMHLSISLGTPTLGIFGSSSVQKSWPCEMNSPLFQAITSHVDCVRPCYMRDCDDRKCFDSITVEEVFDAAVKIMSAGSLCSGKDSG